MRISDWSSDVCSSDLRFAVRQVQMEGGYRDIAIGDRFEVGRMRRRLDRRAEREPVIVVAARIGVADDPKPPVIAQALAGDADALDRVGRQDRTSTRLNSSHQGESRMQSYVLKT